MSKKIYVLTAVVAVVIISALYVSLTANVTGNTITKKISFASAVGQSAPDFTLQSVDGSNVKLSDYRGKNVVLFFNEGGMCYPACWNQIASFGNDARFNSNDAAAFSIVLDPRSQWTQITGQVPQLAKAKILFDTTSSVSSAYDVLSLPSSMHKGRYPGHTYVVIDKNGVIRYVLDDPAMAIRNDQIAAEMQKLG
ncbi:MAG: redoxin domain-containing protein [Candidatus Aenigmatarchaeota archaeon]